MIRNATRYGAWAATLAFATAVATFCFRGLSAALWQGAWALAVATALATVAVAFPGWIMLHRRGRRPGWIGYGLLAMGVVCGAQLLICIPLGFIVSEKPLAIAQLNAEFFIDHGWYTIPVALAGTALFVRWLQRGTTTPPSPVARAGSHS